MVLMLISCEQNSFETLHQKVSIDSISTHQHYTTIPSDFYYYHTTIGLIPTNSLNHEVGDSLSIKVVKHVSQ